MDLLLLLKIVHILIVLVSQAQTEEAFTEVTGSGDGDNKKSATSDVSLIDENGDISLLDGLSTVKTVIEANNENSTLVSDTTESENESTDSLNTTASEVEVTKDYTTISITSAPVTESTTKSTTESSTESTTVATPSTSSTTTTTDTTTTTATSTTTTTTSTTDVTTTSVKTTTKAPTTTTSTTSVAQVKRNRTNTKVVPVRTTSTTIPNGNAVNRCFFLDTAFECDEEIVCHGEGEIDCTEDIDSYSSTTAFLEKVSSVSDDYLDYEDADYNIGTFPPDLIGGKSRRKEIHSLFKIPSLEDFVDGGNFTDAKDDADFNNEETKNSTSGETLGTSTFSVTTGMVDKEYSSSTDDTTTKRSVINSDSSSNTPSLNIPTSDETSNESLTELITTETTVGDIEFTNETSMEHQMLSNDSADTSVSETEPVSDTNTTDDQINIRQKREILNSSDSDSTSSSFKAAALESPKKTMKMKHCRLSGNLVCSPNPTMLKCKGKTFCQAVSESAKAYEKSTTPDKGLKKWAIAVIAISAVVASFVIALLIYLVLTSYKKLKIKPENRVTSLNFINNADP